MKVFFSNPKKPLLASLGGYSFALATLIATCILSSSICLAAASARRVLPGYGVCGAVAGGALGGIPGAVLGYCGAIGCADTLDYLGCPMYDQAERTTEWYEKAAVYFAAAGKNEDYSEGLFLNEEGLESFPDIQIEGAAKVSADAVRRKFEFI